MLRRVCVRERGGAPGMMVCSYCSYKPPEITPNCQLLIRFEAKLFLPPAHVLSYLHISSYSLILWQGKNL